MCKLTTNEILAQDFLVKKNLRPLNHMELIQEGDIVFDGFGRNVSKIGSKHPRLGTEYDGNFDDQIYRSTTECRRI